MVILNRKGVMIIAEKQVNKEQRCIMPELTVRSDEQDKQHIVIEGYALKFNTDSTDLPFTERLDPFCLQSANMENATILLNHDMNYLLGRNNRNLFLEVDDVGLKFRLIPTKTSYSLDLIENIRLGLIDKCSFSFTIAQGGDKWDGNKRTITKIDRLYDVSIVTFPAYDDTEVILSQRSVEQMKNQDDQRKREIEIMKLSMNI